MRPYWMGYLKLALVSFPIALHAACLTSERSSLRRINTAAGNRLRKQFVVRKRASRSVPNARGAAMRSPRGTTW